jgi:antibiotic biosynthesis monooxygenase (ABM) superfamily enzyme
LLQHIGTRKYLALKHDLGLMPEVYPGYVSREYNQAEPNQRLAFKTTLKQDLKVNFKFRFVSKD